METVPPDIAVFDRALVARRRLRAQPGLLAHRALFDAVAIRLLDRLDDLNRSFPTAVDLSARTGAVRAALEGRGGIETLVEADLRPGLLHGAAGPRVACDEEALPFAAGSLDLVLSLLSLHWVNDLPGALVQMRRALKPDGLLLAAMLGGDTLWELRTCLADAEIEVSGGLSPRLSPLADVRDAGALLQRAGFALPVVDAEVLTLVYPTPFHLMRELRGMGESNAVLARLRRPTGRAVIVRAAELYLERHARTDGRIPASFRVLTLTGWSPAAGQQQPARRGSGELSLNAVFGGERHAGGPT